MVPPAPTLTQCIEAITPCGWLGRASPAAGWAGTLARCSCKTSCPTGTGSTRATCPGAAPARPRGGCSSASSCSSRRRSRGWSRSGGSGWSAGRARRTSPPPRAPTCCAPGAGSATRGAPCGCTRRRGSSPSSTATSSRRAWRRWRRCPASAPTRHGPSRRSVTACVARSSTRTSAGWSRGPCTVRATPGLRGFAPTSPTSTPCSRPTTPEPRSRPSR